MLYGCETMGVSDTALLQARRVAARAMGTGVSGGSLELTLYMADRCAGTADPAFAAHVLPTGAGAAAGWDRRASPSRTSSRTEAAAAEEARGRRASAPRRSAASSSAALFA